MDSTAHELLPWYVAGRLEPDRAEAFRAHLAVCESCRKELTLLEEVQHELSRHGGAFLEDHPTAEQLVAAVRGELHGDEADRVKRHLALCLTCEEEAGWVAGTASLADAGSTAPASQAAPRAPRRSWQWAAGLAAGLLLASIPWLYSSRTERGGTAVVTPVLIQPPHRGAGQAVVPLAPGQAGILLIFEIDLAPDRFPVDLSIRDASGGVVLHQPAVTHERLVSRYLYAACARARCPAGEYTVHVHPADGSVGLTFEFEVVEP